MRSIRHYVTKKDGRVMQFDVIVDASTPPKRQSNTQRNTSPPPARAAKDDPGRVPVLPHTGGAACRRKGYQTERILDPKMEGCRSRAFSYFSLKFWPYSRNVRRTTLGSESVDRGRQGLSVEKLIHIMFVRNAAISSLLI